MQRPPLCQSALLLYGTDGCHLCEQADALLHAAGVTVECVDIADHEDLLNLYGTRIPVLRRSDTGQELAWPFDGVAISHFLARGKSMTRQASCAYLLALALGIMASLALTEPATAAGLQISEQSVTSLGRAFAGGGLVNDDVSAAYYNPADLMLDQGNQVQMGMTFIGIGMKANNAGSSVRLPGNLNAVLTRTGTVPVFVTTPAVGRADDGGTDSLVPNSFYATNLNDRMRFGLSITAPFAVSTNYGRNWVGRYHAVESELLTVDINPSLAYRINEHFSVGAGVSAQYAKARLTQALFNPLSAFVKDGYAEVEADGWGFGYNLGALYELDPNTRFSLSYRSRIKHSVEGERTISDYIASRNGVLPGKADVTLPDWIGLAAYRRLDDRWAVMSSIRWTNWSLFDKLQTDFSDGTKSVTPENWQDSWAFSIGASYDYSPEWTFRAGYVYEQTPVPSAQYRTPRIPDNDRNAFALGFSYHPDRWLSVDFGYMYIAFKKAHTENTIDLIPTSPGLITDTLRLDYDGTGHLIGLQASYRF
ncbi:MAG: outer membrane protein transport protein [Candidatus Competibacter denitrificans]